MKSKYINIDLEIETPELDLVKYSIYARIDYSVDSNYGADADGNRGEVRTIVDDVVIIEVTENGKVVKTDIIDELLIQARIEEKFMEGSI